MVVWVKVGDDSLYGPFKSKKHAEQCLKKRGWADYTTTDYEDGFELEINARHYFAQVLPRSHFKKISQLPRIKIKSKNRHHKVKT